MALFLFCGVTTGKLSVATNPNAIQTQSNQETLNSASQEITPNDSLCDSEMPQLDEDDSMPGFPSSPRLSDVSDNEMFEGGWP